MAYICAKLIYIRFVVGEIWLYREKVVSLP